MLATAASGIARCLHCAVQVQRKRACTTHVLRLYRPQDGDSTESVVALCDLETSQGPHTALFNEVAEQCLFASESQVRGRGSTRPAGPAIVSSRGARASVPATRRDQGERADVLIGVP